MLPDNLCIGNMTCFTVDPCVDIMRHLFMMRNMALETRRSFAGMGKLCRIGVTCCAGDLYVRRRGVVGDINGRGIGFRRFFLCPTVPGMTMKAETGYLLGCLWICRVNRTVAAHAGFIVRCEPGQCFPFFLSCGATLQACTPSAASLTRSSAWRPWPDRAWS